MPKDSCPDCYTTKFRYKREDVQAYPDDPEQQNVMHSVTFYTCRRCGWKGKGDERVALKKMSVTKMGKLRSRMRRRR